jgi:hypothetical protein
MSLNIQSLSNNAKAEILARIAHRLTICARDTYEVGTDDVLEPQVLRAYNELLHRVIGAVSDHLLNREGYSLPTILEMMDGFSTRYNRPNGIAWAKEAIAHYLASPENPYRVN